MKTGLERSGLILIFLLIALAGTAIIQLNKPRVKDSAPAAAEESVLGYTQCRDENGNTVSCENANTIPCYTGDKLTGFLDSQRQSGMALALTASLEESEKLEIYSQADGKFFAPTTCQAM